MTPHEINLAIGKSLGFAQCPTAMCQGFPSELCYRKDTYIGELPDFYGSLDRMHEVERSMIFSKRSKFQLALQEICSRNLQQGLFLSFRECIHATSQQRAEAYLRTIGKWNEHPSKSDTSSSSTSLGK